MFNINKKFSFFSISLIFLAVLGWYSSSLAQGSNSVIYVYTSWNVVSRDVRPVVSQMAQNANYSLTELDIDDNNTPTQLNKMNLSMPDQTPYVVIIQNGKVIFKKSYPDGAINTIKQDLSGVLK